MKLWSYPKTFEYRKIKDKLTLVCSRCNQKITKKNFWKHKHGKYEIMEDEEK